MSVAWQIVSRSRTCRHDRQASGITCIGNIRPYSALETLSIIATCQWRYDSRIFLALGGTCDVTNESGVAVEEGDGGGKVATVNLTRHCHGIQGTQHGGQRLTAEEDQKVPTKLM